MNNVVGRHLKIGMGSEEDVHFVPTENDHSVSQNAGISEAVDCTLAVMISQSSQKYPQMQSLKS